MVLVYINRLYCIGKSYTFNFCDYLAGFRSEIVKFTAHVKTYLLVNGYCTCIML